ncbi:zinc-binding dehydrogenase [Microbacterium sp. A8/3-1]|uniref:Zinc-binding dehydrogenase n=1 Tax=Microbacterium sp. A8/3-1 TaxID=3160749 RepID=A0AAU7W1H7_9MICO
MRAIRVNATGGPEVLSIEDIPTPEPSEGQVLIDVEYAGVGFVDTLFRDGTFPLAVPFTPGIEVSGRVRSIGAGVAGFEPGDPVAAVLNDFGRGAVAGGYAESALASADLVIPLNSSIDSAIAAGSMVNGATAWIALHRLAGLTETDTVVVLGASGGIGSAAAHLALAAGATVIAVVGSVERGEELRAAGAKVALRAQLEQDLASIAPEGITVVIDPVGGVARQVAIDALAPLGRLVMVGTASGNDVQLSTDLIWHRSLQVSGISLGGIAHLHPSLVRQGALSALEVLANRPVIARLDQAAHVHAALATGRAPVKTVLSVTGP